MRQWGVREAIGFSTTHTCKANDMADDFARLLVFKICCWKKTKAGGDRKFRHFAEVSAHTNLLKINY